MLPLTGQTYSATTNKLVPTAAKNVGILSPPPTPNEWSVTKKLFTYTYILKVPDNQFSACYLFQNIS